MLLTAYLGFLCCLLSTVFSQDFECEGCCSDNSTAVQCKCDEYCSVFNDCCEGIIPRSNLSDEALSVLSSIDLTCGSVLINSTFKVERDNEAFFMITSCRSSWNASTDFDFEIECQSPSFFMPPVTDIHTGLVYANEFCALCNGATHLEAWHLRFDCSCLIRKFITHDGEYLRQILEINCAYSKFVPPTNQYKIPPRSCVPHVSSCLPFSELVNLTSANINKNKYDILVVECHSGLFELVYNSNTGTVYRNVACASCHGESSVERSFNSILKQIYLNVKSILL